MADLSLTGPDVSTGKVKLTANQILTVRVDGFNLLEIITDGAAEVWYCTGDVEPTVGGRHCYYMPAGAIMAADRRSTIGTRTLRLISDGTPTVVVQRG